MYNFKIGVLGRLGKYQLRNFTVWRHLVPVCELSAEVSDVLKNASNIARQSGSGSVESEFVVKSLLENGKSKGNCFRSIRLPLDFLVSELDAFIRKQTYVAGEEHVAANSASALLHAQSLALSRQKPLGITELSEGLLKYDGFLRNLRRRKDDTGSSTAADCLHNLTERAKCAFGNTFVGRERELERLKGSLNRMRKNNVLLVGEPGVGKTALVERLASDMILEDESITVYSLDLCRLYSGQGARGELETKLRYIFDNMSGGNKILFIDEIHHLIQNQESGVNVTNLLKPIMTSNSVKIIGSTTTKEYHQYFRRDRAFERRFEVLRIRENSADESLAILHGVRPALEEYHNVKIDNEAILAAVELSMRFIPKRFLPDKAIDLLDEASMLAKRRHSPFAQLDEIVRHKNHMIASLIRENSSDMAINRDISTLETEESRLRELRDKQQKLCARLRELQRQQHEHEKNGDLVKAAELKNQTIPELKKLINANSNRTDICNQSFYNESAKPRENCFCDQNSVTQTNMASTADLEGSHPIRVDKFAVANVVNQYTGIPESVLLQSQINNYEAVAGELKSIILGQPDAVDRTLVLIYKHSCGIASRRKIGAALCYVGPSGVGKRTLIQHISNMFGFSVKYIAGSNLAASNATNMLIGSPPGYVGHREGGMLCEWIKEHPYSIVVFEDVHVIHSNVINLLLSAMDNGLLVDSQGEECDLGQIIFVFTTKNEAILSPGIKDNVDDVIKFNALTKGTMEAIIRRRLANMPLVNLRATEATIDHLYRLTIGKEPVVNLIDRVVGTGISRLVGVLGVGLATQGGPAALDLADDLVTLLLVDVLANEVLNLVLWWDPELGLFEELEPHVSMFQTCLKEVLNVRHKDLLHGALGLMPGLGGHLLELLQEPGTLGFAIVAGHGLHERDEVVDVLGVVVVQTLLLEQTQHLSDHGVNGILANLTNLGEGSSLERGIHVSSCIVM
ncbi:ATP-dependent chaperone [Babesia ovis]|uniref:ATP-dependent chaperone n=1 Tax=Babesia ovis TaxID=5869 RepID=A0A9W5TF60_BABOV|nr:ATP-dependent chaperone [Babesia ovis]